MSIIMRRERIGLLFPDGYGMESAWYEAKCELCDEEAKAQGTFSCRPLISPFLDQLQRFGWAFIARPGEYHVNAPNRPLFDCLCPRCKGKLGDAAPTLHRISETFTLALYPYAPLAALVVTRAERLLTPDTKGQI